MKKTLTIMIVIIVGLVLTVSIFGAGLMVGRTSLGLNGNVPYGIMSWAWNDNDQGCSMMSGDWSQLTPNLEPITMEQAQQVVASYLENLNDDNLEISEIMIFDNNGYAILSEKSTGLGAMEVLIDPGSLSVFPEYGPNMMWNLKYGAMNNRGMMGSRFHKWDNKFDTMSISAQEASEIAQNYLDNQFPGSQPSDEITTFYGYYTIDIINKGKPTGMLSVNGLNGQVFLHTWHGTFLEMSE